MSEDSRDEFSWKQIGCSRIIFLVSCVFMTKLPISCPTTRGCVGGWRSRAKAAERKFSGNGSVDLTSWSWKSRSLPVRSFPRNDVLFSFHSLDNALQLTISSRTHIPECVVIPSASFPLALSSPPPLCRSFRRVPGRRPAAKCAFLYCSSPESIKVAVDYHIKFAAVRCPSAKFPQFKSVPHPGGSVFVSLPRHWLVSTERCLSCMAMVWSCLDKLCLAAQTFRSYARCIHAHSDLFQSGIQIFLNMCSYMSLGVLALAASTISSVLSAPIL
jgi:hypothetical protein